MKNILAWVLCTLVLSSAGAMAAGDPAVGARKNQMCQGCHGVPDYRNANPIYSVPRLGGQHAQYIASALQEYKTKARSNTTMQAIAAGLSDQDIQDLAAYYEGQRPSAAAAAGGVKP